MIWASRWSVALRTFYRQILSVLYSSFPLETSAPGLSGYYWYTDIRLNIFYATIVTSTSRTLIRLISRMNRTGVWTVATSCAQQRLPF